ncbi:MAG: energy transducer TonB [Thiomicrorhabdus sp.]|nr:energy transducer TonB [Thiomicrorhabdus sp.]
MTRFTPAKKAFLVAISLYALALFFGYMWYSSSADSKKELVKLTTVPVTLSMFQNEVMVVEPAPNIIEATPPEPVEPVTPPIEEIIKQEAPIPEVSIKEPTVPPKPNKIPVKISPPPKKAIVKQQEPPKLPPTPHAETTPEVSTKILPPPIQETASEPLKEPAPLIVDPNVSAQAEQSYLSELNAIIAQHAHNSYPRRAKRRNWQGEVLIQFTLLPNGQITRLSIIESSNRQLLDNAALQIFQLKMNQQFKPFPKEIVRAQWRIEVPVSYHLN